MGLFVMWLGVMFPLVFSPGPANIVFAASGAQVGVRRSIPLVAGVDTVFIVKSILIGYGLGQVVRTYPNFMDFLQILGAAYLVFLAIKFIKSNSSVSQGSQKSLGFLDGVVLQALSSKGWLMVFLMFSLFTEQAHSVFGELGVMILVVWLAILNISMHLVWVKAGDLLAKISDSEVYEKSLNLFYAVCLLGVAVWLMMDTQLDVTG